MDQSVYPALYRSADEASNKKQRLYLRLVKLEYALLLAASLLLLEAFTAQTAKIFLVLAFSGLLVVLLTRALMKPEKDWYECRALAESIKTLTWRYMMRGAPYQRDHSDARKEFLKHLSEIMTNNKSIIEKLIPDWSSEEQMTGGMDRIRQSELFSRKSYYTEYRVQNQRKWYADKATKNKSAANSWLAVSGIAYAVALGLAIIRVASTETVILPIEPIIVFASSVIGWMHIKKFNELTAAYTVTAHEIGLVQAKLDIANTESDFAKEVTEAEQAFSREHTLWIARQTS